MKVYLDPLKRHDFVFAFDVKDGNPNGDPDAGNLPRVDPETMQGLVTDGCLKRKVRDWVNLTRETEDRMKIYVEHRGILNKQHERAYTALGKKSTGTKQDRDTINEAREWMCANFFDVRAFGAVMTTGVNCGQVQGPLQLTFARSVDPIIPLDLSITRVAVTRPEDAEVSEEGEGGKVTEMGRKAIVPYGLYVGYGFFSPFFAKDTGMNAEDLAVFWEALQHMWEIDRSASRGFMSCRGLYVFTHGKAVGNAPAHELFERVNIKRIPDTPPRQFNDYQVKVNESNLPEGVTLTRLVG
ncbi:MAG TPA: type I-C CRISPR-associated protein Cas7/Csd2 [Firmicutes bacterium]|nr:type I-C CRISPR-associated protein Cas7/Csd2 [Bacillota bacterium]